MGMHAGAWGCQVLQLSAWQSADPGLHARCLLLFQAPAKQAWLYQCFMPAGCEMACHAFPGCDLPSINRLQRGAMLSLCYFLCDNMLMSIFWLAAGGQSTKSNERQEKASAQPASSTAQPATTSADQPHLQTKAVSPPAHAGPGREAVRSPQPSPATSAAPVEKEADRRSEKGAESGPAQSNNQVLSVPPALRQRIAHSCSDMVAACIKDLTLHCRAPYLRDWILAAAKGLSLYLPAHAVQLMTL